MISHLGMRTDHRLDLSLFCLRIHLCIRVQRRHHLAGPGAGGARCQHIGADHLRPDAPAPRRRGWPPRPGGLARLARSRLERCGRARADPVAG